MNFELHPALTATGRFRVEKCLGSGGFGVVYEVWDAQSEARVALKWLRTTDASTLARFKREFRSLADLRHPNLVGFRDLLTVAGEWFFTMDLVDGVELLDYICPVSVFGAPAREPSQSVVLQSDPFGSTVALPGLAANPNGGRAEIREAKVVERPLCAADLPRLRTTLEQLGSALDALHHAGMIHRDVKPSNVLVSREGRVVLLDLGLVTELGQDRIAQTQTGNIVGTPAYMSPEQAMGMALTPASDWYAVGAILFQALTGQLPFDGDPQTLLMKKQLHDPPRASELVRGIPKGLVELCSELLSRTPELRPSGAVFKNRLRQAIATDRAPSGIVDLRGSSPPSHLIDFVGRETHLAALQEAFEEVERGGTVIALAHGTSGIGKTALVRHFLEGLRQDRPEAVVLEGRCYERESVPYKAVDSLVDSLCRHVQRLPPVEAALLLPRDLEALARVFPVFLQLDTAGRKRSRARIDAIQERRRAFEALRELLERVADRRPVVLFIDDLQWGDGDSEPLLHALLRPPDPPALLLIGAYRSEDAPTSPLVRALQNIARAGDPIVACEIPIGELSPEAAQELATSLLMSGHGDVRLAETLARECYGSPLFLRQLAALGQGKTKIDLRAALLQRVAALPEDGRRLLQVLAVSGRPLSLPAAARAAGIDHDTHGVLSKLRVESLVRTRGTDARDEVEIYHDRIREIVVASLGEDELKAVHRKLGLVLSSGGDADAEALATHFYAADERSLAAEYAEKAAERASAALAFARAAEMYEMALSLSSTLGRNADSLVVKLAEVLVSSGRGREAAERFLQAAKNATPADALELRRRAAEQLLFSGHSEQGLVVVQQILSAMKMTAPKTPLGAVISLLWRRIILFFRGFGFRERREEQHARDRLVRIDTCFGLGRGLSMVDPVRGADFQTRYTLLALAAGEPLRIAKALALEGGYRAAEGMRNEAVIDRLLERAASLAERVAQPYAAAFATLMHGSARVLLGDYERGLMLCDKANAELREKCTGIAWELDTCAHFAGFSLLSLGRIRELAERLPAQLEDARARGDLYAQILLRMQCGWFVNLAKGDVDGARADMATVPDHTKRERLVLQNMWQMMNLMDIELHEGNPAKAWAEIDGMWPRVKKSLFLRTETMRIRAVNARGRAALAAADAATAPEEKRRLLAIVHDCAQKLSREAWPYSVGWGLLLEAGSKIVRGERDAGISALRRAVAELEAKRSGLWTISARIRLGELVGGEEGEAVKAEAIERMKSERIALPEKMARVFVPFRA